MNIFLKLNRSFPELLAFVEALFGQKIAASTSQFGKLSVFSCLDIEFRMFDNPGTEDDCGLPLSIYNFQIDVLRLRSGSNAIAYEPMFRAVADYLAARISAHFQCEARLVQNLQTSLSLYINGASS